MSQIEVSSSELEDKAEELNQSVKGNCGGLKENSPQKSGTVRRYGLVEVSSVFFFLEEVCHCGGRF